MAEDAALQVVENLSYIADDAGRSVAEIHTELCLRFDAATICVVVHPEIRAQHEYDLLTGRPLVCVYVRAGVDFICFAFFFVLLFFFLFFFGLVAAGVV